MTNPNLPDNVLTEGELTGAPAPEHAGPEIDETMRLDALEDDAMGRALGHTYNSKGEEVFRKGPWLERMVQRWVSDVRDDFSEPEEAKGALNLVAAKAAALAGIAYPTNGVINDPILQRSILADNLFDKMTVKGKPVYYREGDTVFEFLQSFYWRVAGAKRLPVDFYETRYKAFMEKEDPEAETARKYYDKIFIDVERAEGAPISESDVEAAKRAADEALQEHMTLLIKQGRSGEANDLTKSYEEQVGRINTAESLTIKLLELRQLREVTLAGFPARKMSRGGRTRKAFSPDHWNEKARQWREKNR